MLEDKVVLVVDDDVILLDMYIERIKAEGAIVVSAKDGEEALQQARDSRPHVVLLDVMMPKINGFDVLKQLKIDPDTKKIPVIILSALSDEEKKRTGLSLGAADFIVKSEILPSDIIAKIRTVISSE